MNIFITNSTGYIGFNVSKAFRREGYRVFGLTSSEKNTQKLLRNEIIPIVGHLQEPESFRKVAEKSDLIIHTGFDDLGGSASLEIQTTKILMDISGNLPQPKLMIYTSGTWVYGNSRHQHLTENSPLKPIEAFAWRPKVEDIVLDGNGVVIRPGVVFGRSGGMTGAWFKGAINGGVIKIIGDGRNHLPMIHIDDLAKGCLLAAQAGYLGEVFNLVDSSTNTVMEIASTAATAAGNIHQIEFVPIEEAIKEMGPVAEALAIDQIVDAAKAHRLLNWKAKHNGFVQEVETYYRAWHANQL